MSRPVIWTTTPAEIARCGPRLLERFRKRCPEAFASYKPLKIGIRGDLIEAGIAQMDATIFLSWYTQQPEYLAALAEPGAQRFDLTGQPCGPVSEDNAAYAAERKEELSYLAFRRALVGDAKG